MQASLYDFEIEQGSSFKLSLIHRDSSGNLVDLTGYCARLLWKTNSGEIQEFSTENTNFALYKFIIQPLDGKITLFLPAEITNSYDFRTAKYDLELQSPQDLYSGGGKYIFRILYGNISIIRRFSQSNTLLDCSI